LQSIAEFNKNAAGKNLKNIAKLKKLKKMFNPRWSRKCFSSIKITKMIALQKYFFLTIFQNDKQ
jgi:hypothetical protein